MSDADARLSADGREALAPRLLRGRAIGIIGLGQIGGSLLKALSRHRPAVTMHGHDCRPELSLAMRRYGAWCQGIDDIVDRCDLVVLSVPVHEISKLLSVIAACATLRSGPRRLVVCDTGTVKTPIVRAAGRCRAAFDFVGLHPLAGGERGAWGSSHAGLFRGRPFVVCPAARRPEALVRELIRLVGGVPLSMDAQTHDRIVAETIGLPHVLAFAAAGLLPAASQRASLRGRSWRSLTRVALSDPAMVAGFLHANATNQIRALRRIHARLVEAERVLRRPSQHQLEGLLKRWQTGATARRSRG